MYVSVSNLNPDLLYQGDVVKNFPFMILDKEASPENMVSDSEWKLEITAKLTYIMILSQTCDAQRRKNVLICPVYKLSDHNFKPTEIDAIKKRKAGYWFYLPGLTGVIEDSIADFQTIYYVSRTAVEKYKSNKIISLSDWGIHHLGWALSNYFGRPIESREV